MKVYNALQLKNGAKAEHNKLGTLTQPIQFLPAGEKDEAWASQNLDWLELQGLKQLRRNYKRLLKNYKLANGIIEKSDYIVEEDNEYADLIDILAHNEDSALDLKFFPIIPNIINVLTGEFAKRNDKISFRAVDDLSYNEALEEKRAMIEQYLLFEAEQKMIQKMENMGIDLESEESQQQLDPENLKNLPEIEQFFKKDYRSLVEQWAQHQHNVDFEKFKIKELEIQAFKDMLITDREFWHFKMNNDDYDIELWNPVLTFYHKSPEIRYVSQGNWVGKVDFLTIADVIDKYGYMMTEEQLSSLENIYAIKAAGYNIQGLQNDGSFYDPTKSHKWNTEGPSLAMRQFTSIVDGIGTSPDDVISNIYGEFEDLFDYGTNAMTRVTTCYWKSQRKIGHLSKISEDGFFETMIVDENYKITEPAVYNNMLMKDKSASNLLYGEHIDWIWVNQVWGGIKIGPNRPSYYGEGDATGLTPIYLNVKPVKFQFKGDYSLYGCKLPVEGCIFNDRNTKSTAFVDKIKPFQIGYNLLNNQIHDILIDELGTVIVLDQNALPRKSMGEDWGKNNFDKAYVAMKNFQILPLDTSLANTENPINFQHYQVLNLEQTNRLLGKVNLAMYMKQQAFETVGITQQRLGQTTGQETASGIEQSISMSYAQTEMYFVQHSEHLMPRVHQMRTDLAQYYHSTKPSVRLSYITSNDENINFELNSTNLLAKDLNIFCSTKINNKQIMEQIRSLAINNNTAGASIYDLANLVKADSLAEINHVLKGIEDKTERARREEIEAENQRVQFEQEQETERQNQKLQFEADQNERDRQNNIEVAEIKGAGYQIGDVNQNNETDYVDSLKYLDDKRNKEQQIALQKENILNNKLDRQEKNQLKREELKTRTEIADKQIRVASINKNKYDTSSKNKKKK